MPGDREWAAALRADEMRDWARWAPEPRRLVDRGGLPVREDVPDRREAEADRW